MDSANERWTLQYNIVSHWMSPYTGWSLIMYSQQHGEWWSQCLSADQSIHCYIKPLKNLCSGSACCVYMFSSWSIPYNIHYVWWVSQQQPHYTLCSAMNMVNDDHRAYPVPHMTECEQLSDFIITMLISCLMITWLLQVIAMDLLDGICAWMNSGFRKRRFVCNFVITVLGTAVHVKYISTHRKTGF